jgi:hypothetical protein
MQRSCSRYPGPQPLADSSPRSTICSVLVSSSSPPGLLSGLPDPVGIPDRPFGTSSPPVRRTAPTWIYDPDPDPELGLSSSSRLYLVLRIPQPVQGTRPVRIGVQSVLALVPGARLVLTVLVCPIPVHWLALARHARPGRVGRCRSIASQYPPSSSPPGCHQIHPVSTRSPICIQPQRGCPRAGPYGQTVRGWLPDLGPGFRTTGLGTPDMLSSRVAAVGARGDA